jgi:hypothetical protein
VTNQFGQHIALMALSQTDGITRTQIKEEPRLLADLFVARHDACAVGNPRDLGIPAATPFHLHQCLTTHGIVDARGIVHARGGDSGAVRAERE